ncbi:hypothetical protein [Ornithinibacillus halotolerans]|uniref:Uncharacterized protein n=1 Tax=Ornithinibacillus halotolerans TaxID=1274357 RepID=A0A916SAF6_9BACI|nr:hypothetical protein [Ornithinibacillus halotolerans]GGA91013.1 hypothetical protein GCM10008025_36920 [Ornithinibacillus halotolerans]
MSKKLSNEQKKKVKAFIEEKKKNSKPVTIKGINLKNGEPFEYKLYGDKDIK